MASSRGKNFTDQEQKQMWYNVLHISQDPSVGNGQRADRFKERVQEHYKHNKPTGTEVRGKKSLEGKWGDLKHDVSKFMGCYAQVKARHKSGTIEADTIATTKVLYRKNHKKGKNFNYESCYYILRDCPRWCNSADEQMKQKKMKKSNTGKGSGKENSPPFVDNIDKDTCDDGDVGQNESPGVSLGKRLQGSRNAKDEVKRLKQQGDALQVSTAAQIEMATANSQRARVLENNSNLALLSLPTDGMSLDLQNFMNQWKLEEAIKLKARMDRQHQNAEKKGWIESRTEIRGEDPLPRVRQPVFSPPAARNVVEVDEDSEEDESQPQSPGYERPDERPYEPDPHASANESQQANLTAPILGACENQVFDHHEFLRLMELHGIRISTQL